MGKGGTKVFVAGIITLGACGGSHRATATGAAPTRTTTARAGSSATITRPRPPTPSTNAAPAARVPRAAPLPAPDYSFDDSVAPPLLVNTGTDHIAILKSLESYGTWLGAHRPDPELALLTVAPGTPLLARYRSDTVNLRKNHVRLVEKLNGPSTYQILSATANAFSARVVQDVAFDETVDRAGHVTSVARYTAPQTFIDVVVLARGHWYLAASDLQHPAEVHL